ncbi:HK97 family phage prohead protease [Pseudomonas berkeleyensis]|uniref:HK97 family phage prohead protease n=1 Tax=Pseudomonas berkeleyensis TaxID=2726956 RepID=A0A7G5DTV6_9PSED|nr:HK97 family phage prohead protease [Pseudomonas berkeleyensis]QMV65181.1 HK97 family phage prohead protease [Pseudomonas berkeleyensis]WSO40654.1 HK97 family phage prohead protease [Pseudomonas berkeleyensis]
MRTKNALSNKHLSTAFKVKQVGDDGTFSGYGSVFDIPDSYSDVVHPGAFLESLKTWGRKGAFPAMLWQHKFDEPLGVYTRMEEDDHGLYLEGRLLIDDDPLARRAYAHLKAGSITGLSIGYSIPAGGGTWDNGAGVYHLNQIDLWEVSLVTFPANDAARVDTVKTSLQGPRQFEKFLRDAGLSRTEAKALMADGYKGIAQRDAGVGGLLDDLNKLTEMLRG